MAPKEDTLTYFGIRARGEPTRLIYAVAGQKFVDEKLSFDDWATRKAKMPVGQIPVLTTSDKEITQSTTIARHAAKKHALVGSGLMDETLNDCVVETLNETMNAMIAKVTPWKALKMAPEPEDSAEIIKMIKANLEKQLKYVEGLSKKGKPFMFGDKIQLADIWLYATLEIATIAIPDARTMSPWAKSICEKFEASPNVKKYLAGRGDAPM